MAPGNIAGVVSASGQPLVGADVCARRDLPIHGLVREELEPTCVRTDADGRFELKLGPGIHFVSASAEQHQPAGEQAVLREDSPGVFVQLELLPGGREYTGRVVDLDRKPIAKATVSHVLELGVRRHRAVEVQTDEDGRYRFWSARAGSIRVEAPGHARRLLADHESQQWVLLPEAAISGVVVGRDGRPVANARVAAVEHGFATPPWGWPEHAVRTDAEGRFTIAQLLPDEHELAALDSDGTHAGSQRVHVGLGERREHVVITLDAPVFRYRAQVVEAESEAPVPGCYAVWKIADATFGVSSWTDERGNLDLPLGDEDFELTTLGCPGHVARKPFPHALRREPVRIDVHRGIELHGTVTSVGTPQVGVPVVLSPKDEQLRDLILPDEDKTDALGRFVITGLAPGSYELERGLVGELVIDERPKQEARLRARSSGRLEIEVGREHAGRSIAACDCSEWAYGAPQPWSDRAEVEPSGFAVFERVPIGEVRVSDTECCGEASVPVVISVNETAQVRLAIEDEQAPPQLRVRVLGPNGKPVAGVLVSVGADDEPITPSEWRLTPLNYNLGITDAQGYANLLFETPERFSVVAVRPGQFTAQVLDAEPATQTMEMVLAAVD